MTTFNDLYNTNKSALYDENYYKVYGGTRYERSEIWLSFFGNAAQHIVDQLAPKTILDVGCAFGILVEELRKLGVDAEGFDISDYALSQVPSALMPHIWKADITDAQATTKKYDLVLCIEILEHLSPEDGDLAIANLCQWGDRILFSSTPSDFSEKTHVNVQQRDYWVERFVRHGWVRADDIDASFISQWAMVLAPQATPLPKTQAAIEDIDTILRTEKEKRIKLYMAMARQIEALREQIQAKETQYLLEAKIAKQSLELIEQSLNPKTEILEQIIRLQESELQNLHTQVDQNMADMPAWKFYKGFTDFLHIVRLFFFPVGSRRERAYLLVSAAIQILFTHGPVVLMQRQLLWFHRERRYDRDPAQHAAQSISRLNREAQSRNSDFRVLFVGPNPEIASKRYRIANLREQLTKCHIASQTINVQEFLQKTELGLEFDIVVLFRIGYSRGIDQFLEEARALNIKLVYEIDDYIFEPNLVHYFDIPHTANRWSTWNKKIELNTYRAMLLKCNYFIGSTEHISTAATALGRRSYTIRNGLNDRQLELAQDALAQLKTRSSVRIGYLSGSPTHNNDFGIVVPALMRILNEFPNVQLIIQGPLELPPEMDHLSARIERRPFVTWEKLVHDTATLDINLAPLEINPFTSGKSALKYFEAALVCVPTIASSIEDFLIAIRPMENGLLAYEPKDWYAHIRLLILNPELRQKLGTQARQDVLNRYTSEAQRNETLRIFQHILQTEAL